MRVFTGVIVMTFLLYALPACSQTAYNGNFEQLDYARQMPRKWFVPNNNSYIVYADSLEKLRGRFALRIKAGEQTTNNSSILIYQTIDLEGFHNYRQIHVNYSVRAENPVDTGKFFHFISPQECIPFLAKNVSGFSDSWKAISGHKKWFSHQAVATLTETNCKKVLIGFVVSGIANIVVDAVTISLDATPVADVLLPDLPFFGQNEVRYLESISVPLDNTGPRDLSFLKESVGPATIVALGESTHGTSEFFALRNRIIEYLVDSMKFGIVAFESSFPHTYQANSVMQNRPARKILDSLFGRIHQTNEMAALFDWIKEKKDKGNDLVVAGFDNQWYYGAMRHIKETFAATDRELYSRMEQIEKHRNTYRYSAGKFDTLYQMATQLQSNFLKRQHELLKNFKSPKEMELLGKYISLLSNGFLFEHLRATGYEQKRSPPGLMNFRDSLMAENIAWIKKFYGDKKIIVIAHNGHIKKDDCKAAASCSMGSYLKRQLNNLFVSYIFLTGQGNATGYSQYGEASVYPLKPPRPDCYEYYLAQVSHPAFFFRMEHTRFPLPANIGFLTDLRWRSLGYGPSGPNEFFPINLKNACDAVFFIRNTTNSQSFHLKK